MAAKELVPPYTASLCTMLTLLLLYIFGKLRDIPRYFVRGKKGHDEYAPMRTGFQDFMIRRTLYRMSEGFARPVASAPSIWMDVLERKQGDGPRHVGSSSRKQRCLNLGSYNYLGFASSDEYCTPRVLKALDEYGWATCSARVDAGNLPVHEELEREVAAFVGQEEALVLGMGFATNSLVIPALVGPGCLVLSDALNHASIVAGARGAGAKIKVFGHNDVQHLEALLRANIAEGQPHTEQPWRKILIIVEGIYSMEGHTCPLQEIVKLKQRYKAYLYLDEAHSIGALGKTGRGCAEHTGVDPRDIDIMMGTFSKSFGAAGGYVAANRQVIRALRSHVAGHLHASSMSVPLTVQVLSALRLITGADGSSRGAQKLAALKENGNYVRRRLREMGCMVLGETGSPVVPLMVFNPGKLLAISRLSFARRLALVCVAYPVTSFFGSRARLCLSAGHSRQDLDYALEVIEELADACLVKYRKSPDQQPADCGQ